MELAFSVGDSVNIAGLADETAVVDGIKVKDMAGPGEVVEAKRYAPHVDEASPGDHCPSPHFRVRLVDANGAPHDVWFCGPRLSAA
jgi:hypothetical protein